MDVHGRFHAPVMIFNYEAARMPKILAGMIKWAGRGRTYLVIGMRVSKLKATRARKPKRSISSLPGARMN